MTPPRRRNRKCQHRTASSPRVRLATHRSTIDDDAPARMTPHSVRRPVGLRPSVGYFTVGPPLLQQALWTGAPLPGLNSESGRGKTTGVVPPTHSTTSADGADRGRAARRTPLGGDVQCGVVNPASPFSHADMTQQVPRETDMSELYSDTHRAFRASANTRRLADRLEALAHGEFNSNDRAFIESAAFFFLSTVDQKGRPTVSYKGGPPGFVRVQPARPSSFSRSTTATACFYHLATLRAPPRWACCSSTSNRHDGCVFKAQRR